MYESRIQSKIRAMRAFVVVAVLVGCTERNPDFCASDADCAGTIRPFCDVNGEFGPSNGTSNICTETPSDCPIARCGCTPGEPLACDADQLTSCAADGMSSTTSTCALGCSTEDRCLTFEPSNGLGPALTMAASEPDITLPDNTSIDTDTGLVQDINGLSIAFTSVVIPQPGAPSIRVFIARSLVADAVHVRGRNAFALVTFASMTLRGELDASADIDAHGPGAAETVASCFGVDAVEASCGNPPIVLRCWPGAGGAGNATVGGRGGSPEVVGGGESGGAVVTTLVPFEGGCAGGALRETNGSIRNGGAGGGAVQLVSLSSVTLTGKGIVNVGGGGGRASAGGGSGGLVIIEAPTVTAEGSAAGLAANGGAGGACDSNGADAGITATPAAAPTCNQRSGGNGATSGAVPGVGELSCRAGEGCLFGAQHGGGGGALGRARISTGSGQISTIGAPLLSAQISTTILTRR
jgi:hypothetical protein